MSMDDRTKTVAATGILIAIVIFIVLVIGIIITAKRTVSPVPEEGAIKIIFVSPSPLIPSVTTTPSVTPKLKR